MKQIKFPVTIGALKGLDIYPSWSLLWKGEVTFPLNHEKRSAGKLAWGPPIFWKPRWFRIEPERKWAQYGWGFGWLWWAYSYGRANPQWHNEWWRAL